MINLIGDDDKVSGIVNLMEVIYDYTHFRSIIDLGFQIHHSEFDFEKIMVFSWIKEGIESGRKN